MPSGEPSVQPSGQPTGQPSGEPSGSPSGLPTSRPTSTNYPSSAPTSAPSAYPTGQPTFSPSISQLGAFKKDIDAWKSSISVFRNILFVESWYDNVQVLGECNSWDGYCLNSIPNLGFKSVPNKITLKSITWPSLDESSFVCEDPTKVLDILQDVATVTSRSYSCGSHVWTVAGCDSQSDSSSICVDCSDPCRITTSRCSDTFTHLTISPCSNSASAGACLPSSASPSPGLANMFVVEYTPLVPSPTISSLTVTNVSESTISVSVELEFDGYVHCMALEGVPPVSHQHIVLEGVSSSLTSFADLRIGGLQSSIEYSVFCATESADGTFSSLTDILASELVVSTTCCKKVYVTTFFDEMFIDGNILLDIFLLSIVELPSSSVSVDISVYYNASNHATHNVSTGIDVSAEVFPNRSVTFGSSIQSNVSISLNFLPPSGVYWITASLSGTSSAEYSIQFVGSPVFKVLSSTAQPDVPEVHSTLFSDDGSSINLLFGASTDVSGFTFGLFPCSFLLEFVHSSFAECRWVNKAKLSIFLSENSNMTVGDNITLLGGMIKAECVVDDCSHWWSMNRTLLAVSSPISVQIPTVSIIAPQYVGECDDLVIDTSSSSGTLGRPWALFTMTVTTTSDSDVNKAALQAYLDTIEPLDYRLPWVVPRQYITTSETYTILITLQNFLGGLAEKKFSVSILSSPAPAILVVGSSQRTVTPSAGLLLRAEASSTLCSADSSASSKSDENIAISWEVFDSGGFLLVDMTSLATSPSKFKLAPYSMMSNTQYVFVATAYDSVLRKSVATTVNVYVKPSPIVAVISEGSAITLPKATRFQLDGSSSFDEEKDITLESDFTYSWSCSTQSPGLDVHCPFVVEEDSSSSSVLKVVSWSTLSEITAKISLLIMSVDGRTSTADILVTIGSERVPYPSINFDGKKLRNINPEKKVSIDATFVIWASCLMEWTVQEECFALDPEFDLGAKTLTETTRVLSFPLRRMSAQEVSVNLVLKPNVLLGDTSYQVSLSCTNHGTEVVFSKQSISITTNRPPTSGSLKVEPPAGFAVSTVFDINAYYWEDIHLPLMFEFSYSSNGLMLTLQDKSEVKSVETLLSSGYEHNDYIAHVFLSVFDSFNAVTTTSFPVTILPVESINNRRKLRDIDALFETLEGVGGVITQNDVALAIGTLNVNNCSLAPNCTKLYRSGCVTVPHSCGSCIDGYVGDTGSHNTPCIEARSVQYLTPSTVSRERRRLVGFASCDECLPWEVCGIIYDSEGVSGHTCDPAQKTCADPACSGHGVCQQVTSSSTYLNVTSCLVASLECEARCLCDPTFHGTTCSYNTLDFQDRVKLRLNTSSTLLRLVQQDLEEVDEEQVYNYIESLHSLFLLPEEISVATATAAMDAVELILTAAADMTASGNALFVNDRLLTLLSPLRAMLDLFLQQYRYQDVTSVLRLIDSLSYLIACDITVGEDVRNLVFGSIRIQYGGYEVSTEKALFQTARSLYEEALNYDVDSIEFDPLSIQGVVDIVGWSIQVNSSGILNNIGDETFSSDIFSLRMIYSGTKSQAVRLFNDQRFTATFRNKEQLSFEQNVSNSQYDLSTSFSITTHCDEENVTAADKLVLTCPDTGHRHVFLCEEVGTHTLQCPPKLPLQKPICAQIGEEETRQDFSAKACSLVSFDAFQTTCECTISTMARRDHETRSLPLDFELGVVTELQIDADILGIAASEFVAFVPVEDFNKVGTVITLLMYVLLVMGVVGLLLAYSNEYVPVENFFIRLGVKNQVSPAPAMSSTSTGHKFPCRVADGVGNLTHAGNLVEKALPPMYHVTNELSTLGIIWQELCTHHKWLILGKMILSPFYPASRIKYNYFHEFLCLCGDVLSAMASLVLVYFFLDGGGTESAADCGICAEHVVESNCTLVSVGGIVGLGSACEWDTVHSTCAMRNFSHAHSIWSVGIAALATSLLSTPISAVLRWVLREYVFANTARPEFNSLCQNEGLLTYVPFVICEWIVRKQHESSYRDTFEFLKRNGLSKDLLAVLKNTKLDSIFLKDRIFEHACSFEMEREKENFLLSWGFSAADVPQPPTSPSSMVGGAEPEILESEPAMAIQMSTLTSTPAKKEEYSFFEGLFRRQTKFDIILQQLFRVNLTVVREKQTILQHLQYSSEPLSEIRALKLLVEDLLSDSECNILQAKRHSEDIFYASSVRPKFIHVKFVSLVIVMWYVWGCGFLVYFYAKTRCQDMQLLYVSSFCVWLVLDAVLFQSFHIYFKECFIPSSISEKLLHIQALLVRCICELDTFTFTKNKFKWSLMLFSSARVTSKYYASRLGELILILSLSTPRRSEVISAYSTKALLKLNTKNCDSVYLTAENNQNWETRNYFASFCSVLVSIPFVSVIVVECIAGTISFVAAFTALYLYVFHGVQTMLLVCSACPLLAALLQLGYLSHRPARRVRTKTDRNDEMLQHLGGKPYNPRRKKKKEVKKVANDGDSDNNSIIFHESVICDEFSFDVEKTKVGALQLLQESSLFSDNDNSKVAYKRPLNFMDESSLFDNLYQSEVKAMIEDSSLFSSVKNEELRNIRDLNDSLFDFSVTQKNEAEGKMAPNMDNSLISGLTLGQAESLKESCEHPTGLFGSVHVSHKTSDMDDCSLFSDTAKTLSVSKTKKTKHESSEKCLPLSKNELNRLKVLELLQEDGVGKNENTMNENNVNENIEPSMGEVNVFERGMKHFADTDEKNPLEIPPELLSFMDGKTEDEKLKLIFLMADQTVENEKDEREGSSHPQGNNSTKDQLLQAVLKKNLNTLKKPKDTTISTIPADIKVSSPTGKLLTSSKDNKLIYRTGNSSYSGNVADNKRLLDPSLRPEPGLNAFDASGRVKLDTNYDLDFSSQMEQFSSFMDAAVDKKSKKKKKKSIKNDTGRSSHT